MAIRIYKVAEIVEGIVFYRDNPKFSEFDVGSVLTNLQPVADPIPGSDWKYDILLGGGPAARKMQIDLPQLLSRSYSPSVPAFLSDRAAIVYFRDRLFMPERPPANVSEREEVILRVKKAVYEEAAELSSLRAAVANLEAAIEFQKSGPKRDLIPDDVKLVVWARDGGACIRCGSKEGLHFDHIIPVAKGGGNSEANIQILCQTCNLRKSDKIAVS